MEDNSQFSPEEIQRVQARIDETSTQILANGEFAARYRADPAGTLRSQGLPEEAVTSLLEQASGENEVSGYMAPLWTWSGHPDTFNPGGTGPFNPSDPSEIHGNVPM